MSAEIDGGVREGRERDVRGALLLVSTLAIAVCGLVYELLAGTLIKVTALVTASRLMEAILSLASLFHVVSGLVTSTGRQVPEQVQLGVTSSLSPAEIALELTEQPSFEATHAPGNRFMSQQQEEIAHHMATRLDSRLAALPSCISICSFQAQQVRNCAKFCGCFNVWH